MDDVAVVHDMAVFALSAGAAARQRHQRCAADEQIQVIVVQHNAQAMSDQPGRHRVEHLAQGEPAAARHDDPGDLAIVVLPIGERLQVRTFGVDAQVHAGIALTAELVEERAIVIHCGKVTAAAQQQRILNSALEMAMGGPSMLPFSCATPR